jgi:teichuronic acid biosynthesis glycosyltransferase TuaC
MKNPDLRIAVVTDSYPTDAFPAKGVFVSNIVEGFIEANADVTVFYPQDIWGRYKGRPLSDKNSIRFLRRPYVTFSNTRLTKHFSTWFASAWSFKRAVLSSAQELKQRPSIVYCHFLFNAGFAGLQLAKEMEVPAVVALGESSFNNYEKHWGLHRMSAIVNSFAGVLCVSEENKSYCVEKLGVSPDRIIVVPNAVDIHRFYPRNKYEMRQKYGMPQDCPIVAFVGHFIDRKGPLRVLESLRNCPSIKAFFLGTGPEQPRGPKVLFAGTIPNDKMPEYLSMADVFVLPTLAEGSPNAIMEAMACGLPIVSSDIPCLHEMVNSRLGILVDPKDEESIASAIKKIVNDQSLRGSMSREALAMARGFTLQERAEKILAWLKETALCKSRL